jgi:hypothetical protein
METPTPDKVHDLISRCTLLVAHRCPIFNILAQASMPGQKVAKELKHTPSSEDSPFVVKPTHGSIELELFPWLGRGEILLDELLFSNVFLHFRMARFLFLASFCPTLTPQLLRLDTL